MKALEAAYNQEKALVGAFSKIEETGFGTDGALHSTSCYADVSHHLSASTRILVMFCHRLIVDHSRHQLSGPIIHTLYSRNLSSSRQHQSVSEGFADKCPFQVEILNIICIIVS